MSFVMIATGATSRSRVRTLSVRPMLIGTMIAALTLLGAGGAIGYWVAPSPPVALSAVADAAPRPNAAAPFALEQLGALSGRLFRLESQAAQLSKRVGVLQKDETSATGPSPRNGTGTGGAAMRRSNGSALLNGEAPAPEMKAGSGGPLLPPRAGLEDIATLDSKLAAIERQIVLVSDAAAQLNLVLMRLPTRLPIAGAEMVSRYGNRLDPFAHRQAFHAGIDFAAERGTPIRSAAGGTVVFAGFRPDFGWLVEIEHGNGLITRYAHASKLLVQSGAVVVPGEQIAMVGSTGRSTGPHLHFEVLRNGGHVDPRQYLVGL